MHYLWLALGWLALTLGLIGAVLPVVPTVPFLLIAVWAFARSSPRLGARIMRNPTFGPQLRAWRKRGVIGRRAKVFATVAMTAGVGWSLWFALDPRIVAVQALVCGAVAVWLCTRPEA